MGVGRDTYAPVRPHTKEEFSNITVRNVKTCAQEGLQICEHCKDVLSENVSTFGENLVGMTFSPNFKAENMVIRNFELGADAADSLIFGAMRKG